MRGRILYTTLTAVLAIVSGSVACTSTQTSTATTAPSSQKCQIQLNNTPSSFTDQGGSGSLGISTTRDCGWSATTNANWVSMASTSGQGEATVSYSVAANAVPVARSASISVSGQSVQLSQAAAPCRYSLGKNQDTIGYGGGAYAIALTTLTGCAWTAASDSSWVAITSGASGNASATVGLTVAANPGGERTAHLAIGGQPFTLTQAAAPAQPAPTPTPCKYSLSKSQDTIGSTGGAMTIGITTTPDCSWTAVSDSSWAAITSGASGNASGTVGMTVAANAGAARTANLVIGGQPFTLTQSAVAQPCRYSLSKSQDTIGSNGGSLTVGVTTTAACVWTAASDSAWAAITSGASGTGNGTVALTVTTNTGAARTANLVIGGQPFTLTQSAAPSDTLSVSGAVTDLIGKCPKLTFTVGSMSVTTTDKTQFVGGSCDKVDTGVAVNVSGTLSNNVLQATSVEIQK